MCSVCVPNGGEREQKKEKGKKRRGKKERKRKKKRGEQKNRKQETNRKKKDMEEKRGKTVNNGENTNNSEVVIEEINEETIERSIEKANSFKEEGNKCGLYSRSLLSLLGTRARKRPLFYSLICTLLRKNETQQKSQSTRGTWLLSQGANNGYSLHSSGYSFFHVQSLFETPFRLFESSHQTSAGEELLSLPLVFGIFRQERISSHSSITVDAPSCFLRRYRDNWLRLVHSSFFSSYSRR